MYNIYGTGGIEMVDSYELIERIKSRIAELPVGYISRKTIKGKTQYYRQWRENGKIKSKYVREDEISLLKEQIEERKQLQKRLNELQKQFPSRKDELMKYRTNIITGEGMSAIARNTHHMRKRDCFDKLQKYLYDEADHTRVCAVYGLRRTGKTTMLFQSIDAMSDSDRAMAAYAKIRRSDVMDDLIHDLKALRDEGYKYIFVDEVTLMKDFIDSAALLSDIYVPMGMKIVLSGTDSLGFWLASDNELYDRVRMIHTTFIPFREYERLLGIESIDEYIRYGGMLSQGELAFDDEDANAEDSSFRDDESTRRYIDTAISKNIQHSLACFDYGHYFGPLKELYEAGELTSAINRIIEDMNHRFLVDVLTKDFVSNDLGLTSHNLKNERDPEKRTDILDAVDRDAITKKLMELLDIRNKKDQTVTITSVQTARIKEYLKGLDLIVECPVRDGESGLESEERVIFTQPGMRYCQAQALVYSLMQDITFGQLSDVEKAFVTDRILEDVRGRMLEDIILLESMKALGNNYEVFKYRFASGEFDMVIYDKKERECAAFEIKHSGKCVPEQSRHLRNERLISLTTPRFGTLAGRYVLYLGDDVDTEDGIAYRNAEEFLKKLPDVELRSGLEETADKSALRAFHELRTLAKKNGISGMTLDDINEEIRLARKSSTNGQ